MPQMGQSMERVVSSPETGRQFYRRPGFAFRKQAMLPCLGYLPKGMRSRLTFVITASLVCHLFMGARPVTSQALPDPAAGAAQNVPSGKCHVVLTAPPTGARPGGAESAPHAPSKSKVPISSEQPIEITAQQCEQADKVYSLHGEVEIKFADYVFHGDTVTYDMATGDLSATGHAVLDGGPRDMHITASHGTYNVRSQTGKLYDVSGSSGASFRGLKVTLTSSNPITFAAKMMEQTGPQEYISTFRLKGVPVLYLPKASLPVERLGRQSGFLIPTAGYGTRGYTASEGFYWAINRTMDATVGGQYMSRRGWATTDGFRSRPSQKAFLNASYFQVFDRGILLPQLNSDGTPVLNADGTQKLQLVNQGGEDVKINGETTFAHEVRGVASLEYLSKYVFRTAFAETFSQAVDSEVRSTAFLTKSTHGFSFNGFASRYQNFLSTIPGQVITILHAPSVELSSVDQRILGSPVYGSYDVAAEGLHRSEPIPPGFVTSGLTGRFDVDPELSMPLLFHGWSLRPDVDLRNTFYTQEFFPGPPPIAEQEAINRRAIDTSFEVRPPALTKIFDGTLAGRKVKHVIEPVMTYRYTNGVDNFQSIIRFDFRDILSDTNEVEYGLIQRLYLKREKDGCQYETAAGSAFARPRGADCTPAGADEFLSWEVKQK